MRQMMVALAVIVSSFNIGLAAPAHAEKVCHNETETYTDASGNVVTVVKEVCVENGNGGGGGGASSAGSSGCFSSPGHEIPCTTPEGYHWFDSQFCYAMNVTSVYSPGDPVWQGHADGSLWACMGVGPTMAPAAGATFYIPGPGPAAPPVDPAVLAQQALDRMPLAKPTIHMAPQPPLMTYVGLETWLWMDLGGWDELRGGAKAGATSVTVVAKPVHVAWDLTAGTATCTSAGRPWVKGMSSSEKTDCSYTFAKVSDSESGGAFPVTATITYQVDWTCAGTCTTKNGSLGEVDGPSSQSAIRVGERQSVVVR